MISEYWHEEIQGTSISCKHVSCTTLATATSFLEKQEISKPKDNALLKKVLAKVQLPADFFGLNKEEMKISVAC